MYKRRETSLLLRSLLAIARNGSVVGALRVATRRSENRSLGLKTASCWALSHADRVLEVGRVAVGVELAARRCLDESSIELRSFDPGTVDRVADVVELVVVSLGEDEVNLWRKRVSDRLLGCEGCELTSSRVRPLPSG